MEDTKDITLVSRESVVLVSLPLAVVSSADVFCATNNGKASDYYVPSFIK